jgi:sterol desaturase/sphingolipid hydroxylase (fatty acid hydroxylase superfamily)
MPSSPLPAALTIVATVLLIALERRYPYEPRQRLFREGFWMDLLWYAVVQNCALAAIIALIIARLHQIGTGMRWMNGWPLAAQAVFFLLLHDLYIYWFHRLQHRWPLLWRIHEAHHSTLDVDWLSGTRSHFLEILINQTVEFAPLALLGASPEIWYVKLTVDAIWGMYIHSNIDVRSHWLQLVLNGPEMHRWHHAVEVIDVNFATKFAVWDWLFGTAHLPGYKPRAYGLIESGYPRGYVAQSLRAFRRSRRRAIPMDPDIPLAA